MALPIEAVSVDVKLADVIDTVMTGARSSVNFTQGDIKVMAY